MSKKKVLAGMLVGMLGTMGVATNVFAIARTGLLGTLSGPIMQPLVAWGCAHSCHESEIFTDNVARAAGVMKETSSQESILKAILGQGQ